MQTLFSSCSKLIIPCINISSLSSLLTATDSQIISPWMSRFNLAKKLLPAKKAWKSFKIIFQSKLQKLRTSKAIKRTKNYCIRTLNKIRVLIPCKLRTLIQRSPPRYHHHFHHYYHQQYMRKSSSAIYVDELFPGEASHNHSSLSQPVMANDMAGSSSSACDKAKDEKPTANLGKHQHREITATGVKILENKSLSGKSCEASTSTADAWKIPLLPQLRCIDERAEEFISKFRQEMKLQREHSIIESQEMLARSA